MRQKMKITVRGEAQKSRKRAQEKAQNQHRATPKTTITRRDLQNPGWKRVQETCDQQNANHGKRRNTTISKTGKTKP